MPGITIQSIQEGPPDGPDCLHCHLLPIIIRFLEAHPHKSAGEFVFEILSAAVDVHANATLRISDQAAEEVIPVLQNMLGDMLREARRQIAKARKLEGMPMSGTPS